MLHLSVICFALSVWKFLIYMISIFRNAFEALFLHRSIVEYDVEGFNEISLLLSHDGFFFILHGELLIVVRFIVVAIYILTPNINFHSKI